MTLVYVFLSAFVSMCSLVRRELLRETDFGGWWCVVEAVAPPACRCTYARTLVAGDVYLQEPESDAGDGSARAGRYGHVQTAGDVDADGTSVEYRQPAGRQIGGEMWGWKRINDYT